MSIEAMKLALEELEGCYVAFYEDEDIAEAITALRQAIEQAQKQEQIASVQREIDAGAEVLREMYLKPQRQPLTDEMVRQCKFSCDTHEMRGAFVDGWTSAEQAHGIKENNNG